MKKLVLFAAIIMACGLYTLAASPVVGTWDCVAYADMDYPFTLIFAEGEDGTLAATAESNEVDVGPVANIKLEGAVLTFSIDTAIAGNVDFEATLEGDSLKGTFDTYDFGGEFTGKRRK